LFCKLGLGLVLWLELGWGYG